MVEISKKEERAVKLLREVADNWPYTLWLLSCQGTLYVIKKGEDDTPQYLPIVPGEQRKLDPAYVIAEIVGIDNDGTDEEII